MTEKAKKDIGESTDFLEAKQETLLISRDIYTRLVRKLACLDDFKRRQLELKGRGPTAIVTKILPPACVVLKLINEYLQSAAGRSGRIRHIEFRRRRHAEVGGLRSSSNLLAIQF